LSGPSGHAAVSFKGTPFILTLQFGGDNAAAHVTALARDHVTQHSRVYRTEERNRVHPLDDTTDDQT